MPFLVKIGLRWVFYACVVGCIFSIVMHCHYHFGNTESLAILSPVKSGRAKHVYRRRKEISKTSEDKFLHNTSSKHEATQVTNSRKKAPKNCLPLDNTTSILSKKPFEYLPNFKNPCWYEPLSGVDVYHGNMYRTHSTAAGAMFDYLTTIWTDLVKVKTMPKRLRCLPYFFIAGQPKCGSTDLYDKVTSHPDVITPPLKEPHWWAVNRFAYLYNKEPVPFKDYLDLFDGVAIKMAIKGSRDSQRKTYNSFITGDSSVSNLWLNDYWRRSEGNCGLSEPRYTTPHYIHHLLPAARIIVILRDPTERLYSDYLYFVGKNKSAESFHDEVWIAIKALNRCLERNTMRACVYSDIIAHQSRARLRVGLYYVFLKEWFDVFPRDQFLIIRLEDYATRQREIMKRVYHFLDLRPLTSQEEDAIFDKQHVANARRSDDKDLGDMKPETREILNNFYRPYNKKLSTLLNDKNFLWQ